MSIFKAIIILALLQACSHAPINQKLSKDWAPLSHAKQSRLINKQTKSKKEYNGLHLAFDVSLTFLNTAVQKNNLKIFSQFKNWTVDEASSENVKQNEELAVSSEFFITFYSPKVKRNKLNIASSNWKAVVRINGSEYEGSIKLRENITHHNKVFYPNLNPWSTPYMITFPISTATLENNSFEVAFMGPEGMALFKYKK